MGRKNYWFARQLPEPMSQKQWTRELQFLVEDYAFTDDQIQFKKESRGQKLKRKYKIWYPTRKFEKKEQKRKEKQQRTERLERKKRSNSADPFESKLSIYKFRNYPQSEEDLYIPEGYDPIKALTSQKQHSNIIENLLQFLDLRDIQNLSQTCKLFHTHITDDLFELFLQEFMTFPEIKQANMGYQKELLFTLQTQLGSIYHDIDDSHVSEAIMNDHLLQPNHAIRSVDFIPITSLEYINTFERVNLRQKKKYSWNFYLSHFRFANRVTLWVNLLNQGNPQTRAFELFDYLYDGSFERAYFLNDKYFVIESSKRNPYDDMTRLTVCVYKTFITDIWGKSYDDSNKTLVLKDLITPLLKIEYTSPEFKEDEVLADSDDEDYKKSDKKSKKSNRKSSQSSKDLNSEKQADQNESYEEIKADDNDQVKKVSDDMVDFDKEFDSNKNLVTIQTKTLCENRAKSLLVMESKFCVFNIEGNRVDVFDINDKSYHKLIKTDFQITSASVLNAGISDDDDNDSFSLFAQSSKNWVYVTQFSLNEDQKSFEKTVLAEKCLPQDWKTTSFKKNECVFLSKLPNSEGVKVQTINYSNMHEAKSYEIYPVGKKEAIVSCFNVYEHLLILVRDDEHFEVFDLKQDGKFIFESISIRFYDLKQHGLNTIFIHFDATQMIVGRVSQTGSLTLYSLIWPLLRADLKSSRIQESILKKHNQFTAVRVYEETSLAVTKFDWSQMNCSLKKKILWMNIGLDSFLIDLSKKFFNENLAKTTFTFVEKQIDHSDIQKEHKQNNIYHQTREANLIQHSTLKIVRGYRPHRYQMPDEKFLPVNCTLRYLHMRDVVAKVGHERVKQEKEKYGILYDDYKASKQKGGKEKRDKDIKKARRSKHTDRY